MRDGLSGFMIRYAGTRISRIRRGCSLALEARDTKARETS